MKSMCLLPLCLALLVGGLACASKQAELPVLSEAGHTISLHTAPDLIWLTPPPSTTRDNYFGFGELVVRVQDAQGQPVDGIPVEFQMEPGWLRSASVTPQRTLTRDGRARAIIEPRTIGFVRVMVRVDQVRQEASFLVQSQVGSTTPMATKGLPYPPP